MFKKLGSVYKVALSAAEPPVHFQTVDATVGWAVNLLYAFSACSRIPEPIRVARLIVRGLS